MKALRALRPDRRVPKLPPDLDLHKQTPPSQPPSRYSPSIRVIGKGSTAVVSLVKREQDGKILAMKRFNLRRITEGKAEYEQQIALEIRHALALEHENIIHLHDVFQEGVQWVTVMDYAPHDLFEMVMQDKMASADVDCYFGQILRGVSYMHGRGVAHRDLKLENVVITEEGVVKLIDFGSGFDFQGPDGRVLMARGNVGSTPYLAPEVLQRQYDAVKADVWSLAIIYCCMTLRSFPWKTPTKEDRRFEVFSAPSSHSGEGGEEGEEVTGAWKLLRCLPAESRNVMGRMLELDPAKRATMQEVWEDEWVKSLDICSGTGDGKRHQHKLEDGA